MSRPELLVVLEARFQETPDGCHHVGSNYGYDFWRLSLEVFDQVTVAARCEAVADVPDGWLRADGPGVLFCCLPSYRGPRGFFRSQRGIRRALRASLARADCVVYRGYGVVAWLADRILRKLRRDIPIGIEVVGDPQASLRFSSVRSLVTPFARIVFANRLRRRCQTAQAASYVTESALQRVYPPGPATFATSYSDIILPPAYYMSADEVASRLAQLAGREAEAPAPHQNRFLFVGSLATHYKGLADLLQALSILRDRGIPFLLDILGDGRERPAMQRLADSLGLRGVTFLGEVSPAEVRLALLRADLMILPSHTEGMPRAALEAMAVGCPVLATSVGGVPEILPSADLVPPKDPQALGNKLAEMLAAPTETRERVLRNHRRALDFSMATQQARRHLFLSHLRDLARPTNPHPV